MPNRDQVDEAARYVQIHYSNKIIESDELRKTQNQLLTEKKNKEIYLEQICRKEEVFKNDIELLKKDPKNQEIDINARKNSLLLFYGLFFILSSYFLYPSGNKEDELQKAVAMGKFMLGGVLIITVIASDYHVINKNVAETHGDLKEAISLGKKTLNSADTFFKAGTTFITRDLPGVANNMKETIDSAKNLLDSMNSIISPLSKCFKK